MSVFAGLFTTAFLRWPLPPIKMGDDMMIVDDYIEAPSIAETEVRSLAERFNRIPTDRSNVALPVGRSCVNGVSLWGRPAEPRLAEKVNEDTSFKVRKTPPQYRFRGKFFTPYQVYVDLGKEGKYEISMKFIEEIAQTSDDTLKWFVDRSLRDPLNFWKAVYWELWCLEGSGEKHHIRLVNAIDNKPGPRALSTGGVAALIAAAGSGGRSVVAAQLPQYASSK